MLEKRNETAESGRQPSISGLSPEDTVAPRSILLQEQLEQQAKGEGQSANTKSAQLVWGLSIGGAILVGLAALWLGMPQEFKMADPERKTYLSQLLVAVPLVAAGIERILELVFTWLESGNLACGRALGSGSQSDAWAELDVQKAREAVAYHAGTLALVEPWESGYPAALQAFHEATTQLTSAQANLEASLKNPQYVYSKKFVSLLASLVMGILVALVFKMRLFAALGFTEMYQHGIVDEILTGALFGAGSGPLHDILQALNSLSGLGIGPLGLGRKLSANLPGRVDRASTEDPALVTPANEADQSQVGEVNRAADEAAADEAADAGEPSEGDEDESDVELVSNTSRRDTLFIQKAPGVMDRLMSDFGLSLNQAAGILGNIGHECAGFRIMHELGQPENKGGYGWAQWTGPRRVQFFKWCKDNGKDWKSDEANYGYLKHELQTSQRAAITAIKRASGVVNAVRVFERAFERAGVPNYPSRIRWANVALSAYHTSHAEA